MSWWSSGCGAPEDPEVTLGGAAEGGSLDLHDRPVIVVVDGAIAGHCLFAAADAVKAHRPSEIIIAVPTVSRQVAAWLRAHRSVATVARMSGRPPTTNWVIMSEADRPSGAPDPADGLALSWLTDHLHRHAIHRS